ncbi:MAG: hypothetical protein Q8888_01455 [Vigna little leaf phytoplasma]|nr:hypothetical protein [Vigna little leaf phytoplasma]
MIKISAVNDLLVAPVIDIASEKLVKQAINALESNPNYLETASKIISEVEDLIMDGVNIFDDIPIARNLARGGLELWKTTVKTTSYPTNLVKGIIKGTKQKNYQEIQEPLDVIKNSGKFIEGIAEGTLKTTTNTVKDVGYGIYDNLTKLKWW